MIKPRVVIGHVHGRSPHAHARAQGITPRTVRARCNGGEGAPAPIPRRLHVGYALGGFSTALINNVFILYHVRLYTEVYRVSDAWLYTAFVVYGAWNVVNDPLFGWLEDRSSRSSLSSMQRRLYALRMGGALLCVAFLALFIPWWRLEDSTSTDVPPPPSWLVGTHMMICLSMYDAGLTWVCQAHNALLAEITVDNAQRAVLGRHSATAMMLGSVSAMVSFYGWTYLPYWQYQLLCFAMALVAGLGFEVAYRCMQLPGQVPNSQAQEAVNMLGAAEPARCCAGLSLREIREFFNFAREAVRSSSLCVLFGFGLAQQLHCTFNTCFFPLMVELLVQRRQQLPSWTHSVVLLSSFVLPHLVTMLTTILAERHRECYRIMWCLVFLKAAGSSLCWFGVQFLDMGGWAVLAAIIMNRNVTECGCRLSNLLIADVVDEDRALNKRSKPMSSSIAGLHAIACKPGQSIAPMLGWYYLRSRGYVPTAPKHDIVASEGMQDGQPAAAATSLASAQSSMLTLLLVVPFSVAVFQAILWRRYKLHGAHLRDVKKQVQALNEKASITIKSEAKLNAL